MENSAAGAEERPGFTGIDGFVADDEGEEGADARAQEDAQPVDVEVIQTYQALRRSSRRRTCRLRHGARCASAEQQLKQQHLLA